MSTEEVVLNLEQREVVGKGLATIRAQGFVPAVVHNHGQDSLHVMVPESAIVKVYKIAGKHQPLDLQVGSKKYLALIKDVHFNPVKNRMQHVVFQAIRQNEKVEAEIPIHLEGEIPAEKVGLMILHQLDSVQVEALPRDLPDELVADATKLVEIHDKLTVADLTVPENVTVLTEADHPIATVVETRAQMAEEDTEPETEEGAEGEEGAEDGEEQTAENTEEKQS